MKKVAKRINWKQAAIENGKRVVFALKFMKPAKGGGMVVTGAPKNMEFIFWEDWFYEALAFLGIEKDPLVKSKVAAKRTKRMSGGTKR